MRRLVRIDAIIPRPLVNQNLSVFDHKQAVALLWRDAACLAAIFQDLVTLCAKRHGKAER